MYILANSFKLLNDAKNESILSEKNSCLFEKEALKFGIMFIFK